MLENEIQSTDHDPGEVSDLIINHVLGFGCFAFVFDVTTRTNERQAHKLFLASSNSSGIDPLQEFEREGQMMDMNHENIVKLHSIKAIPPPQTGKNILEFYFEALPTTYTFSDSADRLFYMFQAKSKRFFPIIRATMELCGPTLTSWIKTATTPNPVQVVDSDFNFRKEVGQGIISGLKYLHHDKKIIHRDLKPENIFFSHNAEQQFYPPIKIGDFGLSRPADGNDSTCKTAGVGSQLYRAKDVGNEEDGYASYSYRADLYSLGLILFEFFQLIPEKQRSKYFHDLVISEKHELVIDNTKFPRLKKTIIGLTQRQSKDRIQNILLVNPFHLE